MFQISICQHGTTKHTMVDKNVINDKMDTGLEHHFGKQKTGTTFDQRSCNLDFIDCLEYANRTSYTKKNTWAR